MHIYTYKNKHTNTHIPIITPMFVHNKYTGINVYTKHTYIQTYAHIHILIHRYLRKTHVHTQTYEHMHTQCKQKQCEWNQTAEHSLCVSCLHCQCFTVRCVSKLVSFQHEHACQSSLQCNETIEQNMTYIFLCHHHYNHCHHPSVTIDTTYHRFQATTTFESYQNGHHNFTAAVNFGSKAP